MQYSLRQELQADVAHRGCIADNVASTGEEQVEVLVQLPCAANVERHLAKKRSGFTRDSCRNAPPYSSNGKAIIR